MCDQKDEAPVAPAEVVQFPGVIVRRPGDLLYEAELLRRALLPPEEAYDWGDDPPGPLRLNINS